MVEPWPIDTISMLSEADLVEERLWPDPSRVPSPEPLGQWVPAGLLRYADDLVNRHLTAARTSNPASARTTGFRLRLQGTYLFRVDFVYKDRRGQLLIGGIGSRIFPLKLPHQAPGLFRSLKRIIRRSVTALATDEREGLDPAYMAGVRAGRVHIADYRSLVPVVAARITDKSKITAEGYEVTMVVPEPKGEGREIAFQIALDLTKDREVILCARHWLGPAHRDRLPVALALNHRLAFGRLAVATNSDDGQEHFVFVDRRPYDDETVESYSFILTDMAAEVAELLRGSALG